MSISSNVFTIINDKGLHARASARFVEVVEKFESEVTVEKDGLEASGRYYGASNVSCIKGNYDKSHVEWKRLGRNDFGVR